MEFAWESYVRHERNSDAGEEQRDQGDKSRDGSAKSSTAGQKAREEGGNGKEQGNQEEDPSEPPQVVVLFRSGIIARVSHELAGRTTGIRAPGLAKGGRWTSLAAVLVVGSAEVEVGPLGDVAGAGDALGLGLEEVGLVEGGCVCDAGEDDEEEHYNGSGDEDEGGNAKGAIWRTVSLRY